MYCLWGGWRQALRESVAGEVANLVVMLLASINLDCGNICVCHRL